MDYISELSDELLRLFISYLDIKAVKNLSLTSKKMQSFAQERLWSKLNYSRSSRKGIEFLQKVSHLPIKEFHTKDLCTIVLHC